MSASTKRANPISSPSSPSSPSDPKSMQRNNSRPYLHSRNSTNGSYNNSNINVDSQLSLNNAERFDGISIASSIGRSHSQTDINSNQMSNSRTFESRAGSQYLVDNQDQQQTQYQTEPEPALFEVHKPKNFYNYGSLLIENKGSVARDHLASERTFLAWLRTSLSLASVGVAVTQLLKLSSKNDNPNQTLININKRIGLCFVVLAMITLMMGTFRYFMVQKMLLNNKFPASKFAIFFVIFGVVALSIPMVIVVNMM